VAATWMYSGLASALAGITGEITTPRPGVLRLYVNPVVPNEGQDAESYVECTLPGYAPVAFSSLPWQTRFQDAVVRKRHLDQLFTFGPYSGSPVTIFGSYVTLDATFPSMFYADPFLNPFVVNQAGDKLLVSISMTLRKLTVTS
jgi:hypothetical protein